MTIWEKIEQDIFDYIDGLLSPEKRKAVEKQIEKNPDILRFYNEIRTLKNRLRSLKTIKPSPDFETVLRARIRMERSINRQKVFGGFSRVPAFAFTGVLIAIIIAILFNTTNFNISSKFSNFSNTSTPEADMNSAVIGSGQEKQKHVHYPMDKLVWKNTRGTPVESKTLRGNLPSRLDTSNTTNPERLIKTVDYIEF